MTTDFEITDKKLGAVVFNSSMEMVKGNYFNTSLKIWVLKHPDYCCPFCSHGETIMLRTRCEKIVKGIYKEVYLECDRCFSFVVFSKILKDESDFSGIKERILERAFEVFEKLIRDSKDRDRFILI